jgi:ribosomal-protein-serine acetyltransferase
MLSLKVDSELILHHFHFCHAEELFSLVQNNREYLREWLPWVDGMNSSAQFHSVIVMWMKQFCENTGYSLGIWYRGMLVGCISLHGIDWSNSQTSMGYYLSKDMQGKGIITKAAKALINYAFYERGFNRIEIRCGVGNSKSQAIPSKFGFIQEGIIRDGEYLNGRFHDLIVYGLLYRDWLKGS